MIIKKFGFYLSVCKFQLKYNEITYDFKFNKMYNIHRHYYLRQYLITKIEDFMRFGHKVSHISKMTSTFLINFDNITYEFYPKNPKSMSEWRLFEKLAANPKPIKHLTSTIIVIEIFDIH